MYLTLSKLHINVQMSSTLGIIQFKKFRCPWHLIYSSVEDIWTSIWNFRLKNIIVWKWFRNQLISKFCKYVQMSSTLGIIQFKKFRCPWHLIYSYSSQFLSAFYSLTQVLIVVCLLFQLFIWNYKTAFIGINIRIWSMSFLSQSSNQLTTAVDYELPYKKLTDLM
jgi:hypothetical protein